MTSITKQRIFSGVQPTGNLHLGNYLGAIRRWVDMQHTHESLFCIVDLHAITVPQEPAKLRAAVRETAAAYIACGIDAEKNIIFPQSSVAEHSELAWILSCHTPMGWLNRMTQFKEKIKASQKNSTQLREDVSKFLLLVIDGMKNDNVIKDKYISMGVKLFEGAAKEEEQKIANAPLGLYSYPVLMAADILLYKTSHVPVGEDQKQHIELARDIAGAFNRAYGQNGQDIFPIPEPVIAAEAARIMSLRDGTKKMSKSDESDYSRINLTDDADTIAKKFRKAKSDMIEGMSYDANRPESANLLAIYAALKGISKADALAECGGMNFAGFKALLTDVAVAHLAPITAKMRELLAQPDYIDQVLKNGTIRAKEIANKTMNEVKDAVGFLKV
jgi:tryptophanyl-tRNA synthetase